MCWPAARCHSTVQSKHLSSRSLVCGYGDSARILAIELSLKPRWKQKKPAGLKNRRTMLGWGDLPQDQERRLVPPVPAGQEHRPPDLQRVHSWTLHQDESEGQCGRCASLLLNTPLLNKKPTPHILTPKRLDHFLVLPLHQLKTKMPNQFKNWQIDLCFAARLEMAWFLLSNQLGKNINPLIIREFILVFNFKIN